MLMLSSKSENLPDARHIDRFTGRDSTNRRHGGALGLIGLSKYSPLPQEYRGIYVVERSREIHPTMNTQPYFAISI
jgi:hypothetical protein